MTKNTGLLDLGNEVGSLGDSVDALPIKPQESELPLNVWMRHMCSRMEHMASGEEYRRLIAKRLA